MDKKRVDPGYTQADLDEVLDNPEWTEEEFARARPFAEVFPSLAKSIQREGVRVGKASKKIAVKLQLDADVVAAFQADGEGWQTRINDTLKKSVARRRKASRAA